ncbi:methyl-accepting chemotaxis protein [Enterobacterales bacterium CwR94]|nr:methyl-accepting chemotaxis protein [Enterobacterales bacterium CwR94]
MASVRNLRVGVRLGAAFGLVILLLFVVGATAIRKTSSINDAVDRIVNDRYVKVRLAFDVRDGVNDQIKYLRGMVIDADRPAYNTKRYGQLDDATRKTDLAIEAIAKLQTTAAGQQKIHALREVGEQFAQAKQALLTLIKAGDESAASEYVLRKITPAQNAFLDAAVAFADSQSTQLQAEGARAVAEGTTAIQVTLIFSILAIIAALVLGFFLTRSIVRPLRIAVDIAENVAAGDLRTQIIVRSKDETGQLMLALKHMNDNLLGMISEVRGGTELIATASGQISAGNMDLSSRTEQQASSLEETASAMEEMTATVRQNAENARQANQLAASASEIAVQSGEAVRHVVTTMERIQSSSKKIEDIISVIDGIAFQTNILALNAAVEAARAGEQGRGFAVVATEVRNLAQRSAAAAKEIAQLIEESVGSVEEGTRQVARAGSTMDEVLSSVQNVTTLMAEISTASAEQSSGINEINSAITQMDLVTQQNAALVHQSAAAAQSMQEQSVQLAQSLRRFQVA